MTQSEREQRRPHDDPELFRQAVNFTATQTSFSSRLIEKDYFCTVLLEYLAAEGLLVFKGGTSLAKVHAGFYRLSQDLDFSIPMATDASRTQRRKQTERIKNALAKLTDRLDVFRLIDPWQGANNSTQYTAVAGYVSPLTGQEEAIGIEVGLREPLVTPALVGAAQTLLLDPISGQPLVKAVELTCLSKAEAYAEKFRAALSRREAAIRDFYDLDHAVRVLGLQPTDAKLIELVQKKLAVPGNAKVDVSEKRLTVLQRQLEPELRPVLRESDFQEFDLERAFAIVADMADRMT